MLQLSFPSIMRGGGDIERKTVQFEDNVKQALVKLLPQLQPKLAPTNLKTAAYTAVLDDLVVCSGTFTITLPVATPLNTGRTIGIIVKAGTITVTVASGQVQGAASDSLAAAGMYTYTSTGVDWWRR